MESLGSLAGKDPDIESDFKILEKLEEEERERVSPFWGAYPTGTQPECVSLSSLCTERSMIFVRRMG